MKAFVETLWMNEASDPALSGEGAIAVEMQSYRKAKDDYCRVNSPVRHGLHGDWSVKCIALLAAGCLLKWGRPCGMC